MYYLYLIKSSIKKWYYIGVTDNIKKRLLQHNRKQVRSTKAYAPLMVIHLESYKDKAQALKREYQLKHNNQQRELFYKKLEVE